MLTNKSINRFTKGKYSPYYFAMHACAYFREHQNLLNNKDLCRLYEELLDFLIENAVQRCGWKNGAPSNRNTMEMLIDLFSQNPASDFKHFDDDIMKRFFGYRRLVWALEKNFKS